MRLEQHVHDWIDAGWLAFAGQRVYSQDTYPALVAYYNWIENGLEKRLETV